MYILYIETENIIIMYYLLVIIYYLLCIEFEQNV